MSITTTTTTPQESSTHSTAPMVAGVMGGVVSTTLLLPLDVVKVRLQVSEHTKDTPHTRRLGAIRVFSSIVKHEGIAGVYQGWSPAVIGSAVSWGGYFFLYEGFKNQLKAAKVERGQAPVLNSMDNFTMAIGSGACMVLLTNPVWLIKTRMQLQLKKSAHVIEGSAQPYKGMIDAARTIVREEGFWALYKGTVPAMALTSHGGVQFVAYEFLKKHFHTVRPKSTYERNKDVSVWERLELSLGFLTMGAVSKIIASTVTYPLQVLKARLQQRADALEITPDGNVRAVKRNYQGVLNSVRKMWKQEGLAGFFRGCIPNAIRVAPGSAITFLVYESVMDALS
jgi:solute carrier family 25 (mitochondrial folate transporter), member 32